MSFFSVEKPGEAALRANNGPGSFYPRPSSNPTPAFVKGIYVSAAMAGDRKLFAELVDLVDTTELNTMVIDLKNGNGAIAFAPQSVKLQPYTETRPSFGSLETFTKPLHDKGIYLIGRLFVFQDPWYVEKHPEFAVRRSDQNIWRDRRGIPWLDPASRDVWKYNVAIAREAVMGDYVRFPTDGNLKSLSYPVYDGKKTKAEVMNSFFSYLDTELREKSGIKTSVDLFGLTMWQHNTDLNIGQKLDSGVRHFDFISPMVYPSHYPNGFEGFPNPATHPYEIVHDNMVRGQIVFDAVREENKSRVATARPWLQDFDLGAHYTPEMVQLQMKATVDGGGSGWLLWNARNVYTVSALARDAKSGND